MDPIASGLTILDTIRKAVKTAKKLYNAPKELDELQAEIDTFTLVLNHVGADSCDVRRTNAGVRAAVEAT